MAWSPLVVPCGEGLGLGEAGCPGKDVAARATPCSLPHLPEAFHVDMDSGLVTTRRPLHSYERFNLTVVATDGGEPPLWGTTMLLVEVIDVNDNRPVFVRPPNGTILHIKEVRLPPRVSCPPTGPFQSPAHFILQSHVGEGKGRSPRRGGETEASRGRGLTRRHTGRHRTASVTRAVSAESLGFNFTLSLTSRISEQVTSLSLFFHLQNGTENSRRSISCS